MVKYLSVGKILNFHGIKGEAKVAFSQKQQDFFSSLTEVYVKDDNNYNLLEIESIRFHKNIAIVKFVGIDSINDLMPYKGSFIYVEESTIRDALEEDEFLIDELVGLEVFDENNVKKGFIIGVSNNGASDLLSVKTLTKNIVLIPFVKAIVTDVSLDDKKVTIKNIEGLIE